MHQSNSHFIAEPVLPGCHLYASWEETEKDIYLFNSLFSRATRVRQYQKGSTILDYNEAKDNVVAVASVGLHANHLHLTPDR